MSTQKPPPDDPGDTGVFERPKLPGVDRRSRKQKPAANYDVEHDAKGNPVLRVHIDTPGRRADDETVNLRKILDVDSLSLDDEVTKPNVGGFDPYDHEK
jgi:hypothetical protein